MKKSIKNFIKKDWFILGVGLLVGAAFVIGVRVINYQTDEVHYHANFALYINGQKEDFNGAKYYTEVEMCTVNADNVPAKRAHMHDNINNVIHVEDHAVTWGDFFSNLGWYITPTSIISPNGTIYSENGDNKIHLMLNGDDYTSLGGLTNTVINDKDKLLISYGDQSSTALSKQYKAIPTTAEKYDNQADPKSCSGNHDSGSFMDRMRHAF